MKAHELRVSMFVLFTCLLTSGIIGCTDEDFSPGSTILPENKVNIAPTDLMAEEGVVTIASGAVEDDFVQSGNPIAAVNASLKLVMFSPEVIGFLELQDLPLQPTPFLGPSQVCYTVLPSLWSVEFDFSGCSDIGLEGKIRVSKKFTGLLAGPIVLTFEEGFSIRDVAITGSVGLTRIVGKRLTFKAFTTDPGGAPGTPLTVHYVTKDITATTRLNGKVKLSLMSGELLFWGMSSSTIEGVTSTVYLGGISENEVVGSTPPKNVIVYKLIPFDCYCPSRGVMSGNVTVDIGEVTFDLDDFTPDNGTDDYPSFVVPVSADGSYTATLAFRDCGQMALQFHVENSTPIDFSVGLDVILSALQSANSKGLIPDDLFTQMSAIITNFQGTAPSFKITVGELINKVSKAIDMNFYVPFCAVNG